MAEESTRSATSQENQEILSGGGAIIPAEKWYTHLPIIAKCNVFNGNNLYLWERTVQAALKPRKLIHHLTENCPPESSPRFMHWVIGEELVFAWLLDSLAPEQNARYITYDTSRKLWEAVRRDHSKGEDRMKIINLYIKSFSLQQGEKDVLTYSNELRDIFNDLDHCRPPSTDPRARAYEATNRLCQFLQGLRPEFELVRSQLYNREEEPTFDQAVSKVMQEESRLNSLKGVVEGTAYVSKGTNWKTQTSNRENLFCTHCKKQGHTKEKCWKLHGKPQQFSKAHLAQGGAVTEQGGAITQQASAGLPSAQDFQKIMQELQRLNSIITSNQVIGSTSVANSGKTILLKNLSLVTTNPTKAWILDSGATDHMTSGPPEIFMSYDKIAPGRHVQTADGSLLKVMGIGTINVKPIGNIINVLHVPKLFVNLISVQRLAKMQEYNILFDNMDAYLCHKAHRWRIGLAKVQNGLYYLPRTDPSTIQGADSRVAAIKTPSEDIIMETHMRMGHPSFSLLKKLYPNLFKDVILEKLICEACQLGKFKRTDYPIRDNRTSKPFKLLHCDVWGPSPREDIHGYRWFLICTDDYSRFTWLFLMKSKTEVTKQIKVLCNMIKCQFKEKVQGIRSDNARDFLNKELREFFDMEGIRHETSCPYTPQQNGLAERKIGDIVDKGRTLLIQSGAPANLWGFAVMTAAHLINRLPSQTLKLKSPLELLEKEYPEVKLKTGLPVKIFGCIGYTYSHDHKKDKWSTKGLKCVFVGYSETQKGYKLYHPITRKYIVSKDVVFDEKQFFYKPPTRDNSLNTPLLQTHHSDQNKKSDQDKESSSPQNNYPLKRIDEKEKSSEDLSTEIDIDRSDHDEIQTTEKVENSATQDQGKITPYPKYYERKKRNKGVEKPVSDIPTDTGQETLAENGKDDVQIKDIVDLPIALRKGVRTCTKPIPYDMINYLNYNKVSANYHAFLTAIQDIPIPKNAHEALKDVRWKEAMDEEMRALLQNNTWEIVTLPTGKKPVGCKWVYTLKCKSDGSLDRYKARLVARGYTQMYGIDYQETFAPVAKINTIRILISLAVNLDWPLNQYDIKNAFLHGNLKEEIYMEIPPGYEGFNNKGKVCKLKRALYGLKQSPRAWFGRFTETMKLLGYKQCNGEHTLFFKTQSEGLITILIVYVDDIIITGNNFPEIKLLEKHLANNFRIKQLGPLKYFLGMEFARSSEGMLVTQQKYTLELLKDTKHINCHINDTPIEVNHKLGNYDDDPRIEAGSYQEIVGKLLFLSHTRPDICYSVNVLSQFMHSPRNSHFQAVNRVLRYLKGTPGFGITFRRTGKLDLILYTDSDFGGSRVDYRSTTGYCTFLGGNLVTWRRKKQGPVSKSSTEAEFRAMSKGIDEVIWIKHILDELKIKYERPIILRCDNKSAISIAHDPVDHDRMKHVNIDRFYIRDHLDQGIIRTDHVDSEEQCADIFTKGLPLKTMKHLVSKLGMSGIHSGA